MLPDIQRFQPARISAEHNPFRPWPWCPVGQRGADGLASLRSHQGRLAGRREQGRRLYQPDERRIGLLHHLGMPLHCVHRAAGHLHGFDHTIVGIPGGHQTCAEAANGLMVQAVHPGAGAVQGGRQRARRGHHVVRSNRSVFLEPRVPCSLVPIDVLHQRAAHQHVEQLCPSTDPEHGHLLIDGGAEKGQLPIVTIGFGDSQAVLARRTVSGRVDIGTTADNKPVETKHHVQDIGVAREFNRKPARGRDSGGVLGEMQVEFSVVQGARHIRRETTNRPATAGNADEWSWTGCHRGQYIVWEQTISRLRSGTGGMMGEIVGAAFVAHVPTIVLPEHIRRELNEGGEISLVPSLHQIRTDFLDPLEADTFVVFDTHWFTTVEFVVAAHHRRHGKYTSEELPRGMRQMPYDFLGDPELAHALTNRAAPRDDMWIHPSDDPYLPIHYPTVNLLQFLQRDERWMSMGVCQTGEATDFLLVGQLLADAITSLDRRVVLLASGGMSHTFWSLQELRQHEACDPVHVRTVAARAADEQILRWWSEGDHRSVVEFYESYRHFKPEGRFAHYLMMLGALGGVGCQAPGIQRSDYENSAGTGQVHVTFAKPPGGWTGG